MLLLEYELTKHTLYNGSIKLEFIVTKQAVRRPQSRDVYKFYASGGVTIFSSSTVYIDPCAHSRIFLLGADDEQNRWHGVFFDDTQCDVFVSKMQRALAEWAEWGGFTNEHSGDYVRKLTAQPAQYGVCQLFDDGFSCELQRQLETF